MSTINWALDPTHSEVSFKVRHMMMTNVSGTFGQFAVTASTEGLDFETAEISFSAEISSINTGNEQRDGHLKSADFFDAENHPSLVFSGKGMKKVSEGNYELSGELGIRGVTHPVKFAVEFGGVQKDPWGNEKAGFSLTGKINRSDFGLNWNAALEAGGVLVSEEVKLSAEIQLVKGA